MSDVIKFRPKAGASGVIATPTHEEITHALRECLGKLARRDPRRLRRRQDPYPGALRRRSRVRCRDGDIQPFDALLDCWPRRRMQGRGAALGVALLTVSAGHELHDRIGPCGAPGARTFLP